MVERLPSPLLASGIVGGLCFLCCTVLMLVPTPVRALPQLGLLKSIAAPLQELWQLIRNRSGILAFILCFLPIGTGAVVFSSIAGEWAASSNTVALINGVLGGAISAVGCIAGGWLCDRIAKKWKRHPSHSEPRSGSY